MEKYLLSRRFGMPLHRMRHAMKTECENPPMRLDTYSLQAINFGEFHSRRANASLRHLYDEWNAMQRIPLLELLRIWQGRLPSWKECHEEWLQLSLYDYFLKCFHSFPLCV